MKGIGTDIIEIDSIKESLEGSKRFRGRVFSENEITYCEERHNKYQHYAARFAAKEAVMKALGTGWNNGVQWKNIEIKNNSAGKPYVQLSGKAKDFLGTGRILVSLSHN